MSDTVIGFDPQFDTEWGVRRDSDGDVSVWVESGYLSPDGAIDLASAILEIAGVDWTPLS